MINERLDPPVVEKFEEVFFTLEISPVFVVEGRTRRLNIVLQVARFPSEFVQNEKNENDEQTQS